MRREPTHLVTRREEHVTVLLPVGADGVDSEQCVQLTDLLVRNLARAHEAVAKAEADIAKWLERTGQDPIPDRPW